MSAVYITVRPYHGVGGGSLVIKMSIKLRREELEIEKQRAAERVKEEKRKAQMLRDIEDEIKAKEA